MTEKIKEIVPYIIIIVAVLLIRTFIITPVTVDGPSMEETLHSRDIMLLTKFNKNNLNRYDIIVFNRNKTKLVKRIIALPNETIKCENGKIYINGEEMSNEYGYGENFDFQEVKLKNDEYFVMGDNRGNSLDSRAFGPVYKSQILGKTSLIIFPITRIRFAK